MGEPPVNPPVALLKRNPETAAAVRSILGLPNDRWSEVSVVFGLNDVATATVTLLVSPSQLKALADLVVPIGGSDG